MNVEHRTSNIERPTSNNVFCQLKKAVQSKTVLRNLSASGGFCDSLVLDSIKRSAINSEKAQCLGG